jgi:uncharacterized protein YciI
MASFAYRLLPPRPEFWASLGPGEVALMARHLDHLRRLKEEGAVRFVGRTDSLTGEGDYGFVVIEARNAAQANAIARSDPAVSEGLMQLELHPFVVVWGGTGDGAGPQGTAPQA